ncbi:MAG TPA: ATP-binding cassette domain-containing protein, partial [Conexibacter sp.]
MAVDEHRPPMVEAVEVSRRFGATLALDRVSLAVRDGESRALVGRNGAGKSTLVSILTGLARPDHGEVRFAGRPAPGPGDRAGWHERVACVYQHSTLLPHLTVAENLFVNAHPRGRFGLVSWSRLRRRAAELLEQWSIPVSPRVEASTLRVEESQQVEI